MPAKECPLAFSLRRVAVVLISIIAANIIWVYVLDRGGSWANARLLIVATAAVILMVFFRYKQILGQALNGYGLVLLTFLCVYPLSAFVHLIRVTGVERGFYDVVRSSPDPNFTKIYFMMLNMLAAFLALWIGMGEPGPRMKDQTPPLKIGRSTLLLGIFFTAMGAIGSAKLFGSELSILEALLTIDRSRDISGGLARYVFMSQWMSWGLIFVAAYVIDLKIIRSGIWTSFLILGCSFLILLNIWWTGGRASAIVYLLPGFLLLERIRPVFSKGMLLVVSILVLLYIGSVTVVRTESEDSIDSKDMVIEVLDWHAGRFSMIGMGMEMAEERGLAFGSTLLHGLVNAINTPSTLLLDKAVMNSPQGITSVIGEYMYGNPEYNGAVPGTICEFFYNFGFLGVIGGYFLIGFMVRKIIIHMEMTGSIGTFCLGAYSLVLVCVTLIPGTATAWVYYFVTTGLPVILLTLSEKVPTWFHIPLVAEDT